MRGLPRTFWYLWTGALIDRLGTFVYTFLALYLTRRATSPSRTPAPSWRCGARQLRRRAGRRILRRSRRAAAHDADGVHVVGGGDAASRPARAPWHIAVATLLLGFCSNLFRPAQHATVADVVAPDDRTRAYGYLYWAVNLGFAGAAMLGGFMAERNFMLLFVADAVTTLAFGVIVYLRVPETHPERHVAERARPDVRVPLGDRSFMIFVLAQLLVMLVGSQGNSTLPIDLRDHGVAPATYGWLLAINGVMIVAFQPTAVALVQKLDRGRVLALGALLQGVGFGLTARATRSAGTRSPSSSGRAPSCAIRRCRRRSSATWRRRGCAARTRASTR